jgi:peroxiredoxin
VAMFPHERSLVQRMQDKPFVLLGVDSEDDRPTLRKTLDEKDLTWRNFSDEDQHIMSQWGVEGCPTIVLIDAHGVVRKRYEGNPGEKVLDREIDRLVEEASKEPPRENS